MSIKEQINCTNYPCVGVNDLRKMSENDYSLGEKCGWGWMEEWWGGGGVE